MRRYTHIKNAFNSYHFAVVFSLSISVRYEANVSNQKDIIWRRRNKKKNNRLISSIMFFVVVHLNALFFIE